MSIRQTLVCRSKAPLLFEEGWWRFADGLVLFLALALFGDATLAQSPSPPSAWLETEARLTRQLSGDIEQKRSALFEIRNLKTEQASKLAVPALKDFNEIVRATAASSVIFLPQSEAASVVVPLLGDKLPFVRREAAFALGMIGHWSATDRLISVIKNDKDDEVRNAAVAAIGKAGDLDGISVLVGILKGKPIESNEMFRRSSARSIGQIIHLIKNGDTYVVTPENFLPEKYKTHGNKKFLSRNRIKTDLSPAIEILGRVLQNEKEADDTLREAAFALGEIGDKSSIAIIKSKLNSPDPYLAEICKEALLKIERSK